MNFDPTQTQGGMERQFSREMSLKRGSPPVQVPGYEPERFLGMGAYGEVWVAVERNTGRRVAIKFYAHRGGLDWSLLSREVEKLAFLFADRYVVQLLGVGWESEPPYYMMEYLERGSLADRLQQGPLPVDEAVSLFRDVAVGLEHAHGKGVLHCDLKPANILLDQDNKPRLADFGQSRLSHEQMPALGTMFFMAPEQADLEAIPDARWDVYALGALLFCMLTGNPPHRDDKLAEEFERTPDLTVRLQNYRRMIEKSPPAQAHRHTPGVDGLLADIIDRCLEPNPKKRFANVQAVLHALNERALRRARRPMMILGAIGPTLLLAIVSWFAWQGFNGTLRESDSALRSQALASDKFAARYVARSAGVELERRYQIIEQTAAADNLREALLKTYDDSQFKDLKKRLSDPKTSKDDRKAAVDQLRENAARQKLQKQFSSLIPPSLRPRDEEEVASWFLCDEQGLSLARVPQGRTVGVNYAWRSFFSGRPNDESEDWRPEPGAHISKTTLSAVFRSQATSRWVVAISTPIFLKSDDEKTPPRFLGVLGMTVEVGRLIDFLRSGDKQFAVLIDNRDGDNKGVILQHPLFDRFVEKQGQVPDRFKNYRLKPEDVPEDQARKERYRDPLAADAEGEAYDRHWMAETETVTVRGEKTGWIIVVQQAYDATIGATLETLTRGLVRSGLAALGSIVVLMIGIWIWAIRMTSKRMDG